MHDKPSQIMKSLIIETLLPRQYTKREQKYVSHNMTLSIAGFFSPNSGRQGKITDMNPR